MRLFHDTRCKYFQDSMPWQLGLLCSSQHIPPRTVNSPAGPFNRYCRVSHNLSDYTYVAWADRKNPPAAVVVSQSELWHAKSNEPVDHAPADQGRALQSEARYVDREQRRSHVDIYCMK